MSGRFRSALRRVPATKPSCTESVNQLTAPALRCHSFVRAGTTAEPKRHAQQLGHRQQREHAPAQRRGFIRCGGIVQSEDCSAKEIERLADFLGFYALTHAIVWRSWETVMTASFTRLLRPRVLQQASVSKAPETPSFWRAFSGYHKLH